MFTRFLKKQLIELFRSLLKDFVRWIETEEAAHNPATISTQTTKTVVTTDGPTTLTSSQKRDKDAAHKWLGR